MKNNKDYLTIANERHEANKQAKADKIKLDRDKFDWQRKKDAKNAVITVIAGLPIAILVITFTVIWLIMLAQACHS